MNYLEFIEKYKLEKSRIVRDELISCCPLHKDNSPSFSLNLSTGLWICFAGCGQGDFIDLIAKINKVDRKNAQRIIGNLDTKATDIDKLKIKIKKIIEDTNKEKAEDTKEQIFVDEKMLENFDYKDREYMYGRGFDEKVLKEFEIGKYDEYITIPIRDDSNRLLGIIGRNLIKNKAKYKPLVPRYGLEKSSVLYGLEKIDKKQNTVIIVEGNFDVLKGFQEGFRNVVAIQGSNLTQGQLDLILNNFDVVYIATDNDKPGRDACKKVTKQLRKKVRLYEFKYFTKRIKDFGDMTKEMIQWGLNNARLIK